MQRVLIPPVGYRRGGAQQIAPRHCNKRVRTCLLFRWLAFRYLDACKVIEEAQNWLDDYRTLWDDVQTSDVDAAALLIEFGSDINPQDWT